MPADRKRLRELGFRVGRFPAGPRNALVDVPGVMVGHRTLVDQHTGITAVLPHGGNLYADKVLAACHVVNGYGKPAGLSQLAELGTLESPLLLTNTLAVGAAWEGGLRHVLEQNPGAARDRDTVNVVVAECFDGWLSDARSLHVRPEHALEAIAAASEHEAAAGNVGAGTGTMAFGFKAGIGMASRRSESGHVLGCLVVSNFGAAGDRHTLLGAEAGAAAAGPPARGGSVVVVLATDVPVSERQLRRLGVRGGLGLGRAGSFATNGSGEYVFAFSTANLVPHRSEEEWQELRLLRDDSSAMRELFEMAGEATHEAVLDSLCAAAAVEGRDGHRMPELPYELLERVPRVEQA